MGPQSSHDHGTPVRTPAPRLCRLRPALCNARLERLPDGRIVARLKRRWSGVGAPQGRWRDKIVIGPQRRKKAGCAEASAEEKQRRLSWAQLLGRVFLIGILECYKCGGRRELISVIQDGNTVSKILDHVGIPSEPPRFEPARAPPEEQWLDDSWD